MAVIPCCQGTGKYINDDGTVDMPEYLRCTKEAVNEFFKTAEDLIKNKKFNRLKSYGYDISFSRICMNRRHYKNENVQDSSV